MNRANKTRIASTAVAAALWAGALTPILSAQSATQELKLTVGRSVVIDYPSDVGRISTSNPDVVDAVPITLREILLNAKAFGQSTLVVWSKSGERGFFSVTVDQNLEPIQKLLKDTFPNEAIDQCCPIGNRPALGLPVIRAYMAGNQRLTGLYTFPK